MAANLLPLSSFTSSRKKEKLGNNNKLVIVTLFTTKKQKKKEKAMARLCHRLLRFKQKQKNKRRK
jgi:hypothetical protein